MGVPLIHYRSSPTDDEDLWKIAIPTSLLEDLIVWFHKILGHDGESRVYETIRCRYHHPHLKRRISELVSKCTICRQHKSGGVGFGKLSEKDTTTVPWQETHVDLIGPWKVRINDLDVEWKGIHRYGVSAM